MKTNRLLAGAFALLLVASCDDAAVRDPASLSPSYSANGNSHKLRDTDANANVPADTTVPVNDTIRMALSPGNGNGNGLQNNKNVVWTSSNPAVVSITPNKGTVVAVAQATGTSTVSATLGGNTSSVVIHVGVGAPINMVAWAGNGQTAQVGTAVAVPPAVRVTDGGGNPVPGITVTFAVTSGGGSVTGPVAITDANGVAAVGSWTLGTTPGPNTLDATSPGLPTVTFTATGVSGTATALVMFTQPSDTAQAGIAFAQQPAVQLKDGFNNDVMQSGVLVTASLASGAPTLAGTLTATTDANGRATFTDLRIDGATGTRTLQFSASGVTDAVSDAVEVVAGPADSIVLTAPVDSVLVGDTVTITGQIVDAFGNNVPFVVAVNWSSTNGGTFLTNPTFTDNTGLTTVDFVVSTTSGVTHVVTATSGPASGTISIKSYNTVPTANDDTFDAIGNVTIPVPAPGVLANDSDPESSVSAVPGMIATVNGGTATMNADGSFTYLSASGFSGSDSFTYQVTDGSDTASAQVTMNVNGRIWFVDNSATGPGDGRDASPYVLLKDAETASAASEWILVFDGNGTSAGYDDGFIFKPGQSLIGQGIPANLTVVVNSVPIVLLPAGSAPSLTRNTAGPTVALATNDTLQGFDIASTAGATISGNAFVSVVVAYTSVAAVGGAGVDLTGGSANVLLGSLSATGGATGIRLSNVSGTVDANAGSITATSSNGIHVTGGSVALDYAGSVSVIAGRPVNIANMAGGSITLSGAITSVVPANGVTINNNTTTPVSFSGPLSLTTLNDDGFRALTNTGGLTVTGAGNVISTVGAVGLHVANSVVGPAGLTFQSISASGGANGIVLSITGPNNALTVTGTGAPASGGVIQNIAGGDGFQGGNGIYLASTRGVSLTNMQLNGFTNHAIRGFDVNGFDLLASVINGVSGDNAVLQEGAIVFDGLIGDALIMNTAISGGLTDNVRVVNTSGSLNRITFDTVTIGTNSVASGLQGVLLRASGAGTVLNATVQNSSFTASRATMFQATALGGSSSDVVVSNTQFHNTHPAIVSGAAGVSVESSGANATVTYEIINNSVRGTTGAAVVASKGGGTGVSVSGRVESNAIGASGVPNSGSSQGSAIAILHTGAGTSTTRVANNTIRQVNGTSAINVQAGDAVAGGGNGVMNATVVGNNIQEQGTAVATRFAILATIGLVANDAHVMCLDIGGSGAAENFITNFGLNRIRPNHRFLTTANMPGYIGGQYNLADVTAYLIPRNDVAGAPTINAATSSAGGGFQNTTGSAPCPQP